MATTTLEHRFNSPIQQLQGAPLPHPLPVGELWGTWQNVDPNTRGIIRVVLSDANGKIGVHVFGACTPTPCDWKQVKGLAYDASVAGGPALAFTANYSFSFMDTIVTGHLEGHNLIVEDFNTFKDGSGRAAFYEKGTFKKV